MTCRPEHQLGASRCDLHAALKIIGEFQQHNDVILGLNEAESLHVAKVPAPERRRRTIRRALPRWPPRFARAGWLSHRWFTIPCSTRRGRSPGRVTSSTARSRPSRRSAPAGRSLQRGFVVGRLLGSASRTRAVGGRGLGLLRPPRRQPESRTARAVCRPSMNVAAVYDRSRIGPTGL